MDTANESSADDRIQAHREIIRQSLDEIAADVGTPLRDAGLNYPVFLTVPQSGDALATIATPLDPSDEDWSKMSEIACRVIGKRLGGFSLIGRALPCAAMNVTMSAADVISD